MSMILKEVSDFSVNAFHKDSFTTVTKKDILGKCRWDKDKCCQ